MEMEAGDAGLAGLLQAKANTGKASGLEVKDRRRGPKV
jgi:hypothetical protein